MYAYRNQNDSLLGFLCAHAILVLAHMRSEKVQTSMRKVAVSPEPSVLAHTSWQSMGIHEGYVKYPDL